MEADGVERFQYGYDRNGNVLYKNNLVHSADSELYRMSSQSNGDNNEAYDPLNRLTDFARGTLSSSGYNGSSLDTVASPSTTKEWSLDVLGNWTGPAYTDQNQPTTSGGETVTYDANGNLVENDDAWVSYTYDAWNRLVQVGQPYGGSTTATYGYDALGRRISQGDGSDSNSLYYSSQGQVIEERDSSGDTTAVYYWSPAYVDGLVERVRDSNGDGTLDEHLFAVQDANWNTTALVNTSGIVKERYLYDPYGSVTYLNADWTTKSTQASAYDSVYLFQGKRLDTNTGEIDFDSRIYKPATGTFDQQDADGYINGPNLYQMEGSNPVNRVDPMGTRQFVPGGPDDPTLDPWERRKKWHDVEHPPEPPYDPGTNFTPPKWEKPTREVCSLVAQVGTAPLKGPLATWGLICRTTCSVYTYGIHKGWW